MSTNRRRRDRACAVLAGSGTGGAVLLLLATMHACHCGTSHERDAAADARPDGGLDAPVDAAVDGGSLRDAGRDAATDAGPFVPFPEGWERIPWMPEWCDAWRPRGAARDAVAPLRFVACDPPSAGCEALVVDWERSPFHRNYFIARKGCQTPPSANTLALSRAVVMGFEDELLDASVFDTDGAPVAVFRSRMFYPHEDTPGYVSCHLNAAGATEDRISLAFKASTGRYEETGDDADYSVLILADDVEQLQRSANVIHDLEVRDLFSVGNTPAELHYDGSSVIVQGALGAVYLGSLNGGPWGAIATAGTGDYQSSDGVLFDGTFYWGSVGSSRGWARIRRRATTASVNETLMERPDGELRNFRTDGTWAAWTHDIDLPPADALPDRTDIYVARIDGSFDPGGWSPSVATSVRYPNSILPILENGLYAYILDDRELEVLDLVGRRVWRTRTTAGTRWETLLHMDETYLFAVHKDNLGIDGMRRYRLAELEGWEAL